MLPGATAGYPNLADPAAGRLLGEEEPVLVVDTREEGQIVSVTAHAHFAYASELALLASAEVVP